MSTLNMLGLGKTPQDDDEDQQVPLAPGVTTAQPPVPSVRDYIAQKYGIANQYEQAAGDTAAVDNARALARTTNDAADWASIIGNTIGNGKANGALDHMRAEAANDVTAAQQKHNDQLNTLLTGNELQRQQTKDEREATKFGQEQEAYQHGLERRPTLEGQHDQQAAAEVGLTGAKTGEANAAAASSRATTAGTNYNLAHTKALDDKNGEESNALRSFIYSEVPELAKIGALDDSSYNGMRNGPYKDIIDAKLRAKGGAAKALTENNKFRTGFVKAEGAYNTADAKLGQTLNMVDQAVKGGVASQLVPVSVARDLAGRINERELIAAGGDPSAWGTIERYISKAQNGQMTVKDAQEYRDLIASQRASIAAARNKTRDQDIKSYAATNGLSEDDVRKMLAMDAQPAAAAPSQPVGDAPVTPEEAGLVAAYKQQPAYKGRTDAELLKAIRKQRAVAPVQ